MASSSHKDKSINECDVLPHSFTANNVVAQPPREACPFPATSANEVLVGKHVNLRSFIPMYSRVAVTLSQAALICEVCDILRINFDYIVFPFLEDFVCDPYLAAFIQWNQLVCGDGFKACPRATLLMPTGVQRWQPRGGSLARGYQSWLYRRLWT